MKKYYKIGEISRLYGIGTDSLRYYEEIGILKPKRDTNGYRMYSIKDIRTLNVLRELRSIGFPMNDIKTHLENYNLKKTLSLFDKEIHLVKEKITQLEELESQLESRVKALKYHMSRQFNYSQYEIKDFPGRKVMQLNENVYRDEDVDFLLKKLQTKTENKLPLIGNGYVGATAPLDYILAGNYGHYNSVFYLLPMDSTEYDYILPAGKYITVAVKGSYSNISSHFQQLISRAKEEGHTIKGDPIEIYIIDNHDTIDESEYVTELQMLIENA
ncbi:MAG: MerR family transcriptional regulator [Eubacteriales bacterium]|jgi:DNA-binding transcriptional MerR regulator|nr:MerR family transcriptional regulator [Eubacteriales bacterium]